MKIIKIRYQRYFDYVKVMHDNTGLCIYKRSHSLPNPYRWLYLDNTPVRDKDKVKKLENLFWRVK